MAWHAQIRQVMTIGTFDFVIWTDAEFQCDSNSNICLAIYALVIAQIAFYSQKASDENKNRPILSIYTLMSMHSLSIGLY